MMVDLAYVGAAVAILGLGFVACWQLTREARHQITEPDDGPVSIRAIRHLCNRVDAERAADPNRQS